MATTVKTAILIVDDEPANIFVLDGLLSANGYKIISALSGEQAIDLAKKEKPDLAILDFEMPVMNGYDVCKVLRTTEGMEEIPVIFLTAYGTIEKKIKSFEAGAHDFITKPFDDDELLSRIKIHLELKKNREELKELNLSLNEKVRAKTFELEQVYNELKKQDQLKTEFLILLLQEIKIPLGGISGTLNLLKEQEHSATVKNLVSNLVVSFSTLQNFVDKAGLLSKLLSGNYPLKMNPVDLNELIQFAIIENTEKALALKVEIDFQGLPVPSLVNADKDLIFKSFIFLLDNILMHSPYKEKVEIDISESDNEIKVTIIDLGESYSDEELLHLVGPVNIANIYGAGKLGMAHFLTRIILQLHNGNLTIRNNQPKGSIICLSFNKYQ